VRTSVAALRTALCSLSQRGLLATISAALLCTPEAQAASGQIVDASKNPVPNAWVVARRESCPLLRCRMACVEVKVARTDKDGRYAFSSGLRSIDQYSILVHAETDLRQGGSAEHRTTDPRFSGMDPVTGQIAALAQTAKDVSCFAAPLEQRAALIPLYRAMFREATAMARHPEHHSMARVICEQMYWTQRRGEDASPSPADEHVQRERFLQKVEPACNQQIAMGNERAMLDSVARGDATTIRAATGFDFNRLLDGRTLPIVAAAMKGDSEMVAALAARGAKADAVGPDARTALDQVLNDFTGPPAARRLVVRALLKGGADANRPDIWGYPPLVRAAKAQVADAETFELLLRHGARVDRVVSCNDCGDKGTGVLHFVHDAAQARLAVEHGANVNAATPFGHTPLMRVQTPDVARVLLKGGANPNLANSGGWTPLMYALQAYESFRAGEFAQSRRETAELLVAAGARLDVKNQHGVDPLYYTKDEALKVRLRELKGKKP
jgi:ankyrin repeat protein